MKTNLIKLGGIAFIFSTVAMPILAEAQGKHRNDQSNNSTQAKDEWKSIATISGAIGILGLLTKDNTLAFAGAAGALYSMSRYNQDSRSNNKQDRARAEYFKHDHFYRDGVRYNRKTVTKKGQKYYQFSRAPKGQQDWNGKRGHGG